MFGPHVADTIGYSIAARLNEEEYPRHIDEIFGSDIDKIKVQFLSHRFIEVYSANSVGGDVKEYLAITDAGKRTLSQLMTVRSKINSKEQ